MWRFPEIGVPPTHPFHLFGVHPFWGIPILRTFRQQPTPLRQRASLGPPSPHRVEQSQPFQCTLYNAFGCFAIGAAMGNILKTKQPCFASGALMGSILYPKQYCFAIGILMGCILNPKQYCVVWDWKCPCFISTALDQGFLWTGQGKSAYCEAIWP